MRTYQKSCWLQQHPKALLPEYQAFHLRACYPRTHRRLLLRELNQARDLLRRQVDRAFDHHSLVAVLRIVGWGHGREVADAQTACRNAPGFGRSLADNGLVEEHRMHHEVLVRMGHAQVEGKGSTTLLAAETG